MKKRRYNKMVPEYLDESLDFKERAEDPYLISTAKLGVSFVRGLQGHDKRHMKTAACAKHFAAHSGLEGKRHEFNAVVSPKDMAETYLPAFKVLSDAGVARYKERKEDFVFFVFTTIEDSFGIDKRSLLI